MNKKYLTDYEKRQTLKPDGGVGYELVYIGKHFRFQSSEKRLRRRRLALLSLTVLATAFCLLPCFFNFALLRVPYLSLPQVLTLFPLFHLWLGVIGFCLYPEPLTRERRDKTEGRIALCSFLCGVFLSLVGVCGAVLWHIGGYDGVELTFCASVLLSGACSFSVFFLRDGARCVEDKG